MTRDELLAKIHEEDSSIALFMGARTSLADALRAVIELHKPYQGYIGEALVCQVCRSDQWAVEYPCETIQAIEAALI